MYVDPYIISWALLIGASVVAFIIGYMYNNIHRNEVINNTIMYLIDNNYVKAHLVDGEWDIEPLDDEK